MKATTIMKSIHDINTVVTCQNIRTGFIQGDANAHRFEISVVDGENSVNLNGKTALCDVLIDSPQSPALVPVPGEISGNVVTVVLPGACYVMPGRINIVVRLVDGEDAENRVTILWASAVVVKSKAESIIDPGDVIPDLTELLAQIDQMKKATKAANEAADRANYSVAPITSIVKNIEVAARGTIEDVTVNADIAYRKPVIQNSLPYAVVDSLGGMTTVADGAMVDHAPAAVVGVDTLDVSSLVQKYFPDGMRSAGAVYDELDFENGVAIKRVGVVDLGTINWQAMDYRYSSRGIDSTIKRVESSSVLVNATCSKYAAITNDESARRVVGIASAPSGALYIYDTNYDPATATAAEFKQSLAGVMLNYELAEHVVTPIEERISPAVRVVAGGNVTVENDKGNSVSMPSRIAFSVKKSGGGSGGGVTDVKVDGTTVVSDCVADIPLSADGYPGLAYTIKNSGLDYFNALGGLALHKTTTDEIDERTPKNLPVIISNLDYAVKAAMCDGNGAAWTAEEQAAAQQRLGILSVEGVTF